MFRPRERSRQEGERGQGEREMVAEAPSSERAHIKIYDGY